MDDIPYDSRYDDAIDERSLLALIKARPEVYDHSHRNFKRIERRAQAWVDIADELNTTVAICKNRWKQIRNVLRRDLKTATKKKPYYLLDDLKFYIPHIYLSNKVVMKNENDSNTNEFALEQEDTTPSWKVMQPLKLPPLTPIHSSSPQTSFKREDVHQAPVARIHSSSSQTSFKREDVHQAPVTRIHSSSPQTSSKGEDVDQAPITRIHASLPQKSSKGEDVDQGFLFSLLPDLETLDPGKRRIFKEKVSTWLRELHEEMDNERTDTNQLEYIIDSSTTYEYMPTETEDMQEISDHALQDHIY